MWLEIRRSTEFRQQILAFDPQLGHAIKAADVFIRQPRWDLTPPSEAATIARRVQYAASILLPDTTHAPRKPDGVLVSSFAETLTGPGSRVIFLNHGIPTTTASIIESAGLAFILGYIQARSKKPIVVETSPNMHAAEVGVLLAEALSASERTTVSFGVNDKLAGEEMDTIWGRGRETAVRIMQDMGDLLLRGRERDAITIYITGNAQTNAADILASQTPAQLAQLGMRVFVPHQSILFQNGLYSLELTPP